MAESSKASRWITPVVWILGAVFLAAAFLKAWDINKFTFQINNYQMVPASLQLPAAFFIVALEAFIGIGMITGFKRGFALAAGGGLLVVFLAATGFRWNLLQGHDCGCFGSFDRGGPSAVLWQDSILLLLVILAYVFRSRIFRLSKNKVVSIAIPVLCLATATYSAMSDQSKVASVNASDAAAQGQLNIVIYLSSVCPHCIANSERINKIVSTPGLPPVKTYLGAENNQQIAAFLQEGHLSIPFETIPFNVLWLMTRSVPVIELRRGETIVGRWDAVMPTPQELLDAVAAQKKASSASGS